MDIYSKINQKFHIHRNDTIPFYPWLDNADRTLLAELFFELGFTKGAEVGVRSGAFSKVLLDLNPNLHLLCIDPWTPYAKVSQARQDRLLRYCRAHLREHQNRITIMKLSSMDALKEVPDNSLDFVYIDGLHDFDSVMMDLIGWNRKVKRGGIISGHDYHHFYQYGIIHAVDACIRAYNIHNLYITRGRQEEAPSFFWVKP